MVYRYKISTFFVKKQREIVKEFFFEIFFEKICEKFFWKKEKYINLQCEMIAGFFLFILKYCVEVNRM